LNEFKGTVLHSAQWDESLEDWSKKNVGVIGVVRKLLTSSFLISISMKVLLNSLYVLQGSSAIQIVPALQPKVAHLLNYVRGKTWLASPIAINKLAELTARDPKDENCGIYLFSILCLACLQVADFILSSDS
jgi:hypothetical protein